MVFSQLQKLFYCYKLQFVTSNLHITSIDIFRVPSFRRIIIKIYSTSSISFLRKQGYPYTYGGQTTGCPTKHYSWETTWTDKIARQPSGNAWATTFFNTVLNRLKDDFFKGQRRSSSHLFTGHPVVMFYLNDPKNCISLLL